MAGKRGTNIRLSTAVKLYLERSENEGQAPTTLRSVRYSLERFTTAVSAATGSRREPDPWLHLVDFATIDSFFFGSTGIRRGVGALHFNRQRSILKVFFDYALTMRWVDINPVDRIPVARPDMPKQRLMLNAGELLALLEHAGNPIERVALAIGMNTGLRANDIRHLTIFDASLASGEIQTTIRKTHKLDIKPITMELHRELVTWFDLYAEYMELDSRADLPNDWLVVPSYRLPAPRERRHHIHPRPTQVMAHPYRLVQRNLARMGYPTKGEGFHTLRRSSARAFFESLRGKGEGRDHALMIVKEFLNHSSVVQTEHYLGLNQERTIRDALLKDKSFLGSVAESEQARVSEGASSLTARIGGGA